MVSFYFSSDIHGISFHTYLFVNLAVTFSHNSPFSNYKKAAPLTKKVREKILTFASSDILFCLDYTRLGLICTPKEFWAASPRSITFVHLYRSPELLPRSSDEVKSNSDCWLLAPFFYHNSLVPSVERHFSTFYAPVQPLVIWTKYQ